MKHTRIVSLACLSAVCLSATAGDKVVIVNDNAEKGYAVSYIDRININGDGIEVVGTDNGATTYAFDAGLKILLVRDATAIDATAGAQDNVPLTLTVSADGSRLTVGGWAGGTPAGLSVYDASGASVLHCGQWTGGAVDVSALPGGVYLMRLGGHTAKFRLP